MALRFAVQGDYIRHKNGEEQSFSRRWRELAAAAGVDVRRVDVYADDLFRQLEGCDALFWRFGYLPHPRLFAKRLLPAVEHGLGIPVYPSSRTAWHFEDKIAQSYLLAAAGIPTPRTWVFWQADKALEFARAARYPLVLKLSFGFQSGNVKLLQSADEAALWIERLFGPGVTTLREGVNQRSPARLARCELQRGYFYVQEFVPDNAFDTRVTVIGNRAFAFRRFNRPDDFRASGSGLLDWDPAAVDPAILRLAFAAAARLGTQSLAVDGLVAGGRPLAVEISYTFASWAVRDCPGHWTLAGPPDTGALAWTEGRLRPEDAIFADMLATVQAARPAAPAIITPRPAAAAADPAPWTPVGGWKTFSANAGVHAQLVRHAAHVRGIAVEMTTARTLFRLSHAGRSVSFWNHTPDTTSLAARLLSNSKDLSKLVLARAGVRVPEGRLFAHPDAEAAWSFAESVGLPVVVKPKLGSGGKGVTADIRERDHFDEAWTLATLASKAPIIVEKHVAGNDYRLFAVGDRLVCATRRIPANVVGDGASTIADLIRQKNVARADNPYAGAKPVKLLPMMKRTLHGLGLNERSVLEPGRRVLLHPVANIGGGGDSVDVTADVHPDFAALAVRALQSLPGAVHAGIDLLAPDIAAPASGQTWAVCEINTCPDIAMHHFPVSGTPRDAAGALLEHLFPDARPWTPDTIRKAQVLITGKVVGVGFRRWIQARAHMRGLTGFVRNTPAGEVEALFCGAPSAVADMIEMCRHGPGSSRPDRVDVADWTFAAPENFQRLPTQPASPATQGAASA